MSIDTSSRRLYNETLNLMLKWASRMHPSDIEFKIENLTDGISVQELLVSFGIGEFNEDLLDEFYNDKDNSKQASARRIERINEQLRSFYIKRNYGNIDELPSFAIESSNIVAEDIDSLARYIIVIYGVVHVMKHRGCNMFIEVMSETTEEIRNFTNQLVTDLIEQLRGHKPTDYATLNKELRAKIAELNETQTSLYDRNNELEGELARVAKSSLHNQELESKVHEAEQTKARLTLSDEQCRKLEIELADMTGLKTSIHNENVKLKRALEESEQQLREQKDMRTAIEHRLTLANSKNEDYEAKLHRMTEASSQKPSEREFGAMKERYQVLLAENIKLQDEAKSKETLKQLLADREARLEQARSEKEAALTENYTQQKELREIKATLKEFEARRLAALSSADNNEPTSRASLADEFSELSAINFNAVDSEAIDSMKLELEELKATKRSLEDELRSMKTYVESDKEKSGSSLAQARYESEQLALQHATMQSEFSRQKFELDGLNDKLKRVEEKNNTQRTYIDELEVAIKRSGYLISEYVFQNDDGSSTGISGSECLQLRAEVQRLQEQIHSQRLQADAYRHIATEEQRLITAEWYEHATRHLQQRFVASISSTMSDSNDSAITSDYLQQATSPHLYNLQASALSSARSTPTQLEPTSMSLDRANSASNELAAGGFMRRLTPSFLKQQNDAPLSHRALDK